MRRSTWAQAHYDKLVHDPEFIAAQAMLDITEQIMSEMAELGFSQHELARRIGKKQPFLSRLLNHGTNVTILTLAELAVAFDAELEPPRFVRRTAMEDFLPLCEPRSVSIGELRHAGRRPALARDTAWLEQPRTVSSGGGADHVEQPVAA